MAAGYLDRPGTKFGPCETECLHTDCAATRRMVASPCATCGEPIGYDRGFFSNHDEHRVKSGDAPEYEHELCAYERTGR